MIKLYLILKLLLKHTNNRLKIYSYMKNRLHHQHFMIKKRIDTEMDIEEKRKQRAEAHAAALNDKEMEN